MVGQPTKDRCGCLLPLSGDLWIGGSLCNMIRLLATLCRRACVVSAAHGNRVLPLMLPFGTYQER